MEGIRQGWVREAPPTGPYGPPPGQKDPGGVLVHGRVVAQPGYRIAAFVFDTGVAVAALTAAILAGLSTGAAIIVGVAAWMFVTSAATAVFAGQTLGKRLAGVQVLTEYGMPIGFGTSLLRDTLARLLYFIPLFFIIDSVFAAADDNGQTLRDKMVGTYVVRDTTSPGRGWAVALTGVALFAVWFLGTSAASDEPGEGYSGYDRTLFMDSCRDEGSSRSRCACLYEFITTRLSHDEYSGVRSDDPADWPAHVRRVTNDAATACDGAQPSEPPPGSTTS